MLPWNQNMSKEMPRAAMSTRVARFLIWSQLSGPARSSLWKPLDVDHKNILATTCYDITSKHTIDVRTNPSKTTFTMCPFMAALKQRSLPWDEIQCIENPSQNVMTRHYIVMPYWAVKPGEISSILNTLDHFFYISSILCFSHVQGSHDWRRVALHSPEGLLDKQ